MIPFGTNCFKNQTGSIFFLLTFLGLMVLCTKCKKKINKCVNSLHLAFQWHKPVLSVSRTNTRLRVRFSSACSLAICKCFIYWENLYAVVPLHTFMFYRGDRVQLVLVLLVFWYLWISFTSQCKWYHTSSGFIIRYESRLSNTSVIL